MDPFQMDPAMMMGGMMQQPFYGAQPQMMQQQQAPQLNNLYKTQYCKHFQQQKHCHVGNKCHFAHGEHELRKKEDPLPIDVQMKMLNIPYNNYKTQRCKYYEQEGVCKFGKNCSYAHGEVDMRNPYENVNLQAIMTTYSGTNGSNINGNGLAQQMQNPEQYYQQQQQPFYGNQSPYAAQMIPADSQNFGGINVQQLQSQQGYFEPKLLMNSQDSQLKSRVTEANNSFMQGGGQKDLSFETQSQIFKNAQMPVVSQYPLSLAAGMQKQPSYQESQILALNGGGSSKHFQQDTFGWQSQSSSTGNGFNYMLINPDSYDDYGINGEQSQGSFQ